MHSLQLLRAGQNFSNLKRRGTDFYVAVKIARVRFLYARFANGKPGSTLTAYEEPVKFVKSPRYVTIDIRVFFPPNKPK